ncbi:hypothetical protein MTO96_031907 [Rhipicephalus appendiculatus]
MLLCVSTEVEFVLVCHIPAAPSPPSSKSGKGLQQCLVCGYTTPYAHVMRNHNKTHTDERPYKCAQCNKSFKRKGHLAEHLYIHSGEKFFKCHLCPSDFAQKAGLVHHLKKHKG